MGYKGAISGDVLRKYVVGMECRQTEQRMKGEIDRGKGKVNVEGKAMQRGESADTTWSVERDGTAIASESLQERIFAVRIFRSDCRWGKTASRPLANHPKGL